MRFNPNAAPFWERGGRGGPVTDQIMRQEALRDSGLFEEEHGELTEKVSDLEAKMKATRELRFPRGDEACERAKTHRARKMSVLRTALDNAREDLWMLEAEISKRKGEMLDYIPGGRLGWRQEEESE